MCSRVLSVAQHIVSVLIVDWTMLQVPGLPTFRQYISHCTKTGRVGVILTPA